MSACRELLDRYVERYNAKDLDAVMDLYAEDAVQLMPDGTFAGRSAIRERLARDLDACPDVHHTVRSFVEQGDMELCVVRDGKLVVDNLYYDSMAVLVQLGLLPQGATA